MNLRSAAGILFQINVNPAGGVPKSSVEQARVTFSGVGGDKQKHRRFHGGPTRAVSLYSLELIQALQEEGHPILPGSTGENLTVRGIPWNILSKASRLRIGEVLVEITGYAAPCAQISSSFVDGDFPRISARKRPGWSRLYARVLEEGSICRNDAVFLSPPASDADYLHRLPTPDSERRRDGTV